MRAPFDEFKKANPGLLAKGVEVGVWEGGNAIEVVQSLPLEKFWLVDCFGDFSTQPKTIKELGLDENPNYWDDLYKQVQERFAPYPNVEIVKQWSHDAAVSLPDELDFVYIDATHTYEGVLKDLRLWEPKVRAGGWVMGDDWTWPGVVQAVNEFTETNGFDLKISSNNTQWWFVKPV